MSWKPKKSAHNTLFDGTKTKLLVSSSNLESPTSFLNSQGDRSGINQRKV